MASSVRNKNFAVFCSGEGTNLQAIIEAVKKKRIKANLALVVCDNPGAYAIKRACSADVKTAVFDPKKFSSKEDLETAIMCRLKEYNINFIVLAGYMRVLSEKVVSRYRNRILNIHPALLPSFKGGQAIEDALKYGVKVTGVTVHLVTRDIDGGPIVLQEATPVKDGDGKAALLSRVHKIEHKIYPKAIDLLARGKLKVEGRRVIIK